MRRWFGVFLAVPLAAAAANIKDFLSSASLDDALNARQESQEAAVFDGPYDDMGITDRVDLETFPDVQTAEDCVQLCRAYTDSLCNSVNYFNATKECSASSSIHQSAQDDFGVLEGSAYYQRQVIVKLPADLDWNETANKTTLILVGVHEAGKSSLCRYLLFNRSVCDIVEDFVQPGPGEKVYSRTTEVELARGYWFGNPELGLLEVMDTPGFTGDDDTDAEYWHLIVDGINDLAPTIDALVYANTGVPSYDEDSGNAAMLNRFRETFGLDIWQYIVSYTKYQTFAWKSDDGFTQNPDGIPSSAWDLIVERTSTFAWSAEGLFSSNQTGFNETDYGDELRNRLRALIVDDWYQSGGNIISARDSSTSFRAPGDNPSPCLTGGDFVACTPYYSQGVPNLTEFRDTILQRSGEEGKWDLGTLNARFGASLPDTGLNFTCRYPDAACNINVTGRYLTQRDSLRIFPESHICGDPFDESTFVSPVGVLHAEPDTRFAEETTIKHFSLGQPRLAYVGLYKLCYCEFGLCTIPERYFQEIGHLEIKTLQCQVTAADCHHNHAEPHSHDKEDLICNGSGLIDYNTEVTHTCDEGFTLNGELDGETTWVRRCSTGHHHSEEFGDYTNDGHGCSPISCVLADPPRASFISGNSDVPFEDSAVLECEGEAYSPINETLPGEPFYWVDGDRERNKQRLSVICRADGTLEFDEDEDEDETFEEWRQFGCRRWEVGPWGACSAACGEGTRARDVFCSHGTCSGSPPADTSFCLSKCECTADSPANNSAALSAGVQPGELFETGETVVYECNFGWTLTGAITGSTASLTRYYSKCEVLPDGTAGTVITDIFNVELNNFLNTGCRRWEYQWSACSVTCGIGFQSATQVCSTGRNADCAEDDNIDLGPSVRECEAECEATTTASEGLSTTSSALDGGSRVFFMMILAVSGFDLCLQSW